MAAAATIGSSFSAAMPTLKSLQQPKLWTPDHHILKINATKTSPIRSLASYCYGNESLSINNLSKRRRALRIASTVEEAVETATDEATETAVEEKEEVEEMIGGEGDVGGDEMQINTKLYFGNLPYHCDSAQLAGIVQQYGTPELVEVLYNRETGKSRGFAFVTMSSVEDADAVIENLDGSAQTKNGLKGKRLEREITLNLTLLMARQEYGGRFMRVNFSDKPRPRETLYPETEHKLFVGNLSWSVTSESLYQIFQEHGSIVGARVLYDGETGKSRGYGFVSYASREEMETALQALDGVELEGRAIRVSVAQGKRS